MNCQDKIYDFMALFVVFVISFFIGFEGVKMACWWGWFDASKNLPLSLRQNLRIICTTPYYLVACLPAIHDKNIKIQKHQKSTMGFVHNEQRSTLS